MKSIVALLFMFATATLAAKLELHHDRIYGVYAAKLGDYPYFARLTTE